ncbi:MAG: FkbM family methyltransferase [Pseudomonadota bacterium]
MLAEAIARTNSAPFVFVDVGANVGLYCLFARAAAQGTGRALQALAIEPASAARARLETNLRFSGAGDVTVAPVAVTAHAGPVRLAVDPSNRGESRLTDEASASGETVEGAPLADILARFHIGAVDAMKIDIEGGEAEALSDYFEAAPQPQWPRLLIAETGGHAHNRATEALCLEKGYRVQLSSRLNTVFALDLI